MRTSLNPFLRGFGRGTAEWAQQDRLKQGIIEQMMKSEKKMGPPLVTDDGQVHQIFWLDVFQVMQDKGILDHQQLQAAREFQNQFKFAVAPVPPSQAVDQTASLLKEIRGNAQAIRSLRQFLNALTVSRSLSADDKARVHAMLDESSRKLELIDQVQ